MSSDTVTPIDRLNQKLIDRDIIFPIIQRFGKLVWLSNRFLPDIYDPTLIEFCQSNIPGLLGVRAIQFIKKGYTYYTIISYCSIIHL